MINSPRNYHQMSIWIFFNAFMVFMMVAIGGITRLTDSGLSMTDWNFFSGMIPPVSDEDWLVLFEKYKLYPEFNLINYDMTMSEFKKIFFWEYLHRMWGRLIGLTFFLPLLFFVFRGFVSKKLGVIFTFILGLGCLQGFMGWYMVSSGLIDRPDVSQYRLAAHLGLAFLIYTLLIFIGWSLFQKNSVSPIQYKSKQNYLFKHFIFSYFLLFTTIISGAFVAGTKSGLIYNSFPLMGANLYPDDIFTLTPFWLNFFENMSTIQFNHRALATITCIFILYTVFRELRRQPAGYYKIMLKLLLFFILLQYLLGITAVIHAVPFVIGITHQIGGLINLTLITLIISEIIKRNYSFTKKL